MLLAGAAPNAELQGKVTARISSKLGELGGQGGQGVGQASTMVLC